MSANKGAPKEELLLEKQILSGLVLSTEFLLRVSPICDEGLFSTAQAAQVARAAIDFGRRYQRAPGSSIRDLVAEQMQHANDDDLELMELLLDRMELEELGVHWEYLSERAEGFFAKRKLERIRRELSTALLNGDVTEAENVVASYAGVRTARHDVVDVFRDEAAIAEAFAPREASDVLLRLPGDLGEAVGDLERGMLISILAPMKRGKSWWLQELAYRGLSANLRVLVVDLEMTAKQRLRRVYQRITARPKLEAHDEPGKEKRVLIPVWDCARNQEGTCRLPHRRGTVSLMQDGAMPKFGEHDPDYTPCDVCRARPELRREFTPATWWQETLRVPVDDRAALRKAKALLRSRVRGGGLKITSIPTGSGSVRDLEALLANLEHYEGWVPDIIVTDYADLFAANTSSAEHRHQIYDIWVGHKRIAQKYGALVVTASQSNTARSGKRIGQGDWAEDIRKLALIDVGISLDQTPEEKRKGLMRVGVIAHRHKEQDILAPVLVRQQLAIGNPLLDGGFQL